MNMRLHKVLLTLWDIARDNPGYNRRLWGELQHLLSQLETRNNLLCALLSDLLHCTDDSGNVIWEEASIHSPPQGYAVKFMREELQREKRPTMPRTPEAIPTNTKGEAIDPRCFETRTTVARPVTRRGVGGAYDDDGNAPPPPLPKRGESAKVPRIQAAQDKVHSTLSPTEELLADELTVDYGLLHPSPIGVGDEYDVGDESEDDELAFDFPSSDDSTY